MNFMNFYEFSNFLIAFFLIFEGFSKLFKDKVKAKQEVDRIFLILGNDNNKIDYTGTSN